VAELEKGITERGSGYAGKSWNILGQVYFPKATCESTFAFETNTEPGQFVLVHIHPTQDEFILVQEGMLDLKLDGKWSKPRRAIWCGYLAAFPTAISTSRTDRLGHFFGYRRRGCSRSSSIISTTSPIRSRS
jgi:hypothetical protein